MVKDISELEHILQQDGAFRGLAPRAKAKALLCFLEEYHPDVHAQIGSVLKDGEKENDVPFNPPVSVSGEAGLVVALDNEIFCLLEAEKYLIAKRDDQVRALASHEGRLYDGGDHSAVFDTLSGMKVAQRNSWVYALVSHDGSLYDGGRDCAVFDTLGGKEVARRRCWVRALASHGSRLYDGGDYKAVFDTFSGKEVAQRDSVHVLTSHNGGLYDGGKDRSVVDTLSGKKVSWIGCNIYELVSHRGGLYGCTHSAIFDMLNDPVGNKPLWEFDSRVTSMASIPFPLWEELARKGTLVRN